MPKSKPKKSNGVVKNGVHKNGVHKADVVALATLPYGPPPTDPSIGKFRAMKQEMESEIKAFKDRMLAKYTSFNGYDLRKDLSWYLEQMGASIASDMERVKRDERQRMIARNQAEEKLAASLNEPEK